MANHTHEIFKEHDDYMTPKTVWKNIQEYIPKDKTIWEAFYGDGKSGQYLTELGFNVIHKKINFFDGKQGDIIVSNPPFSLIKEIIPKLFEYDMPFILIMPVSRITREYFRLCKDKNIQLLIPRRRIQFIKMVNGKILEKNNRCNFDCFYYCYKMNLPKDIIFL